VKILDTSVPGPSSADLAYVAERNLIAIPTFMSNTVSAYELND
jgi:hypothetical protein